MNIFQDFQTRIEAALAEIFPPGLDLARATVEPPRDPQHGDIATNAAMIYAKETHGKTPRALAMELSDILKRNDDVEAVEIAGPGFINIRLKPVVFERVLCAVLKEGEDFGSTGALKERVNVEYVSANPTGPMHVGHARGAVFGDALANLLAFAGWDVAREYYINDAGAQVDILARSAYLRYREALGEEIGAIEDGLYPGDYLKAVGQKLAEDFGDKLLSLLDSDWLPQVRSRAIDMMMETIKDDLAALGVRHDVFFSERSLIGEKDRVAKAIETLRAEGYVYEGRLAPPKGAAVEDWEDREQTLFRSTQFGDDVDRPLKKSDGSYTYFASDIAYHNDKIERGFASLVNVWGADHGGYVKRMKAAVQALSGGKVDLEVRLCQLVRLMRRGEPVKMSKRSGDFVTLREVVDEVGVDPVRFMMLMRKNDAMLDFDLAKVVEQSADNPVFYVQYAHARAASIDRMARAAFPNLSTGKPDLSLLTDEAERALLRRLAAFPRVIAQGAQAREPHRLAFFAHDLATEFHFYWTKGRDQPHLRCVLADNKERTQARHALATGVKIVLKSIFAILGISAPEEMR